MRYPNAVWQGAADANYSHFQITPKFIVVHIMQGSEAGTDAWFHNPRAIVSSHFGVSRRGIVEQYVDTNQEAYAEMAYNGVGISVEHEGYSGQHLSVQQVQADMKLFAWIARAHRIPLVWRPNGLGASGVVSHGELGVSGGDHPYCPGEPIVTDIKAMLRILGRRPTFPLKAPYAG